MKKCKVMCHVRVGGTVDSNPTPGYMEEPKWINVHYDADIINVKGEFVEIRVPELGYTGWTDAWYININTEDRND